MAKVCNPNPNPDENCLSYEGGQCQGVFYIILFTYEKVSFTPETGELVFPAEGAIIRRGRLGCISQPIYTLQNSRVNVDLTNYDDAGVAVTERIEFGNQLIPLVNGAYGRVQNAERVSIMRVDGLPDNCGNFVPNDDICECTGGDQEITCVNAQGGICCISKSALDRLCDEVS